jgi:transcriptional regulator with XRE-family HTH domain
LERKVGPKKQFSVKSVAEAVGVSSPSVSTWVNDKSRPNQTNLQACLRFIGEDPAEVAPELFGGASGLEPSYGAWEEAALKLSLSNPLKATAYIMASQDLKEHPPAFYKKEGVAVGVLDAEKFIRLHVGESVSEPVDSNV